MGELPSDIERVIISAEEIKIRVQEMADQIEEYLKLGLINIVGGCCGSTPDHIRKIAEKASRYVPRSIEKEAVESESSFQPQLQPSASIG